MDLERFTALCLIKIFALRKVPLRFLVGKNFFKKSEQMFAFFGKMCYTDFAEHLFLSLSVKKRIEKRLNL